MKVLRSVFKIGYPLVLLELSKVKLIILDIPRYFYIYLSRHDLPDLP